IDSPPSQRPWSVFAYMALATRPVSRAELAVTFWPDVLDQSARASLRSALWALRRHLGERLRVQAERVGLLEEGGLWIDAREFDRLAADSPEQALALCRGELLEGIDDDWAMSARQRHRERVIGLLERQALLCDRRGDARSAIDFTRRQVEQDPFDEEAHRRLIARLAAGGDRAGAVRAYRSLTERLRSELGVAPAAQTRELLEQVRAEPPAAAPARVPAIPGLLPLVGRQRELAMLDGAWRRVADGAGAVALIRGEAGIGKTRLASELRLRAGASGGNTAACAALDLGGSAPFSLWAELIRELLPLLPAPPAEAAWPDDLALLAPELPVHFARSSVARAPVAPDLQQTRLFEAVVAMLAWGARERPLLLVVEDAHSADIPSLELAGYAARRVAALPVMLLITRRGLPPSGAADRLEQALRARGLVVCELELGPLASDQVTALARSAAPLSDADASLVVARAEGNPLLAVEAARALEQGRDEIAPSLRGSVRATLAPLPEQARDLIELASVAARPIDAGELGQLALQAADEAATVALQTGLLLSVEGRIGFRHALLRDAVYQEVAEPRRRGLHRRWAEALLASEAAGAIARPAEVARQLRLAGADARAVPQLARAAAEARAVAALVEAVAYLEEAVTIAPDQAELWLELGELEGWRGRREQAEAAFARGLALLEGHAPLVVARAWLRQARVYHGTICVPRAVLDSASKAVALLEQSALEAPEERSEALAAQAWAEAVAGSVGEAERLLAELSAEASETDDLRTYDIGHARALALMRRGRFIESYGPSIAAGEAIDRAGRPDLSYGCWINAAGAATAAQDHERALEFLDRGMRAIERHGLQSLEIHVLAARSFVLTGLGRIEEARSTAESEQALAEQLAQPELLAMASHDRGLIALREGSHQLAATLLGDALLGGAPISRPRTRLALAEALARSGDPERAAGELRAAVLEPIAPSDFPTALVPALARVQGLIAIARGALGEAEQRLNESIAGWERLLERGIRAESVTTVLADLGRPVVGLVEPERELTRARADLQAIESGAERRRSNAVVP
ncbi:MAG: AAA family ATPase, partial [Solirubrobacterales bacterium]|nr:AAA family ATPase [Solirubrobacterales bacterium]